MNVSGFGATGLAVTQVGALGVNLFFVLSGFLIARSVLLPPEFSRRAYFESRVRRILPNYLAALLIVCCIADARGLMERSPLTVAGDLAAHLTFLHGWIPDFAFTFSGVLWTLSHEWWFYMIMLATAGTLRAGKGAWLVVAGMAGTAFLARFGHVAGWWALPLGVFHPLAQWDGFTIGIAGAILVTRPVSHRWIASLRVRWLMAAIGSALILLLSLRQFHTAAAVDTGTIPGHAFQTLFQDEFYGRRSNMLWFVPGFATGCGLIIICLWEGSRAASLLRLTPLPWMGKVSYSTYLYHVPVISAFGFGLRRVSEESLWRQPWFSCPIVLAAVYLVSSFAYHHIEKPWQQRRSSTVVPRANKSGKEHEVEQKETERTED